MALANLASVMLLGMMVVGTSASYADVTSKNNQEAIEVLQKVGIMTGDQNGNFNPDEFGRPATKWTYKNSEIGTYSDAADYTYTGKVTKKALYNDLGKNVYDDVTATEDGHASFTVTVDGKDVENAAAADYLNKNSTAKIGVSDSNKNGYTGNGTLTEVYVDDNNNVKVVIINTYVVKAIGDYSSSKGEVKVEFPDNATTITLSNSSEKTLSDDDFAIADVKEDDYLLITVADGKIKTVAKAETVTGEVTSYSNGNDVTLDGTTYKYTNNIKSDATNGKTVDFSVGDNATVVLDAYGYIIYVDDAKASSKDFVYVSDIDTDGKFSDKDVIAKAYFTDGTNKTITIKNDEDFWTTTEDDTKTPVLDTSKENHWYTYSEKKSGKYELTIVGDDDFASVSVAGKTESQKYVAATLTDNGKTTVGVDATSGKIKANKATVFIVLDEDDNVKLYEGISKVPTIKTTAKANTLTAYAKMDDGYAEYVFIDASDASTKNATTSDSERIYLLDFDRTAKDKDDNTYYQYNAIVNGEKTKVKIDNDDFANATNNPNEYQLFDGVAYDSETGYISDMDLVNGDDYISGDIKDNSDKGVEITYSKGLLSFASDNVLADKYNIYLVVKAGVKGINDNDKDYTFETVTGSGLESQCKNYKVTGTYVGVLNDDDEITDLYVYIDGAVAKAE